MLPVTCLPLSITCSIPSVIISPHLYSQPQSSLHPNKCQSGSRISLPVLHSSHKSGVGTLCKSLRRKLFLSDEPRIHLPPTLTLPALSFNRLGQLTFPGGGLESMSVQVSEEPFPVAGGGTWTS